MMRLLGGIRQNSDIFAITGVLIITILLVGLGNDGPLRVILGIVSILFLPGYILQAALFPKDNEINLMERVILSFALSVAVIPLIILILNYTPWGIKIYPVVIMLCIYVTVFCFIVIYRRGNLSPEKQFNPLLALKIPCLRDLPRWHKLTQLDKVFIIALLFTVIFTGVSFHIFASDPRSIPSSEFYMISHEGNTNNNFRAIKNGEEMKIRLGVVNRERQDIGYAIKVNINGSTQKIIGPFNLKNNEKWVDTVNFSLPKYQKFMKAEFILIKSSDNHPYRSIHLWIENFNN